jgi:hypothetical protein
MANETELAPPPLSGIMAFRGVHVLGTIRYEEGRARLTASHYASCLVAGQNPLWAVWAASGKFLRFYGSKQAIADNYKKLVWRRKMAEWSLMNVSDLTPAKRRAALNQRYGSNEN